MKPEEQHQEFYRLYKNGKKYKCIAPHKADGVHGFRAVVYTSGKSFGTNPRCGIRAKGNIWIRVCGHAKGLLDLEMRVIGNTKSKTIRFKPLGTAWSPKLDMTIVLLPVKRKGQQQELAIEDAQLKALRGSPKKSVRIETRIFPALGRPSIKSITSFSFDIN